ncbi:QWRF motif-containing protein 4 [Lactuca sativa]|uniref:AUGMIN subunit 8 n=1 Tax=Lactuca sativa TaxID=4236 RepID=A0A9R1USY7_LACSA|nr:QWRF motif-containing protein 4 [Lactuca sativa]XP_023730339.1 QWRF motif-containing protein 4 [Lactuca sativa]XP_023730340.1 QWRF motif-containing protein 4 [Lactuca sativa]XP_023730341.1 QWRF motif-containing protein 4 [Lactuca sativa]XP_042752916.1 QWRF motif-containing protein 4 [Lactuca sativa]XP_042752917.1 QWRF motif-containing protein 4 [Lactuca sativa]KAJ0192958.1 hypothetical protein LSAT_V11C800414880 [Lactuca sativa]
MDVCESNQASDTRKIKNNGRIHRDVNSRYKSPTPRRFPSPNTKTTVTTSTSAPISKRAVSAGRRQPPAAATPPSPPSPSTPVHDTSIYTELAARKATGSSKLPESLWPSRMRSLNVAFQSTAFSMPISKKEKPPPQAMFDRTLKPSSNVGHKPTVTPPQPTYRKATPERNRSPLKGKNTIDHLENSKPFDRFDHHRWPNRTGSSNVLTKNIDPPDHEPVTPKSTNGNSRKPSSLSYNPQRISNLFSEKNSIRSQSPNKSSGIISRGVSPSRTRVLISPPPPPPPTAARGASPSRGVTSSTPTPSPQLRNSNTVSVLTFIADIKKGKKVANRIEDAHNLRLLYNRQVQWRFVNAGAEATLNSQKLTAERSLLNAQRTTSRLQDSVTAKRVNINQMKLQLKLYLILMTQTGYLNQWCSIERDHNFALHGAIEDLKASTLRLPVTGWATANIQSVKSAVYSAIQVMQSIGSSLQSTLSRLEGTNWVVSELATVAAQERALLDQCEALLTCASSLQVEEYTLRTHLIQLKQDLKSL